MKKTVAGIMLLMLVLTGCTPKITAQSVIDDTKTAESKQNMRMTLTIGDDVEHITVNSIYSVSDNYVELDSGVLIPSRSCIYTRRYEIGDKYYREYDGKWVEGSPDADHIKDMYDVIRDESFLNYFVSRSVLELDPANVNGAECHVIKTQISGDDPDFKAIMESSSLYPYVVCLKADITSYIDVSTNQWVYSRAEFDGSDFTALKEAMSDEYDYIPFERNMMVMELGWDDNEYEQAKAPDAAVENSISYNEYYAQVIEPELEREKAKEVPEFVKEFELQEGENKILAGYYLADGSYSAYEPAKYNQSWTKKDEDGNELAWYDTETNTFRDENGAQVDYYANWKRSDAKSEQTESVSEGDAPEAVEEITDFGRDVSHFDDVYSHTPCEICEYLVPIGKTKYPVSQICDVPEDSDLAKVILDYFNEKPFQTMLNDIDKWAQLDELHKYAILSIIDTYDFQYTKGKNGVLLSIKDTIFLNGMTEEEYNDLYNAYRQYARELRIAEKEKE